MHAGLIQPDTSSTFIVGVLKAKKTENLSFFKPVWLAVFCGIQEEILIVTFWSFTTLYCIVLYCICNVVHWKKAVLRCFNTFCAP